MSDKLDDIIKDATILAPNADPKKIAAGIAIISIIKRLWAAFRENKTTKNRAEI